MWIYIIFIIYVLNNDVITMCVDIMFDDIYQNIDLEL